MPRLSMPSEAVQWRKCHLGLQMLQTASTAGAQFVLSTASDSVQVFTQWGKEKAAKKNSPKVLLVRLENSNPQPVQVNFEINFIDNLKVVETSGIQKIAVGPSKGGKPKRVKLKFKPASYNPDEIDGVDIQIEEVEFMDRANY